MQKNNLKFFILGLLMVFAFVNLAWVGDGLAATTEVAGKNLKQLDMVGRLALSLGLTVDEVQAEVDAGKTLQQVAADHGMPAANFKSRILNANFNLLSAKKKPVVKVVKKAVVKKVVAKKITAKKVVVKKTSKK